LTAGQNHRNSDKRCSLFRRIVNSDEKDCKKSAQCVIIGNDKLQLIPSGDGTFVVSDGADIVRGTNVLVSIL
jgi:hypothetical protein